MRMLWVWLMLGGGPVLGGSLGCGAPPPQVVVDGQTLTVGCGTCMFKQLGGQCCYWAARVGDEVYPMRGTALPTEEQLPAHGPEGMCTMERTAVVDGQVHGGLLMVESFQLLPADPDARRADPHQHEHEAR